MDTSLRQLQTDRLDLLLIHRPDPLMDFDAMADALQLISEHACYGGVQRFYSHQSNAINLPMRFAAFIPAQASAAKLPALIYLAGLTCTEETFMTKAGAQRVAAELGMILIAPDTSARPGKSTPAAWRHWPAPE